MAKEFESIWYRHGNFVFHETKIKSANWSAIAVYSSEFKAPNNIEGFIGIWSNADLPYNYALMFKECEAEAAKPFWKRCKIDEVTLVIITVWTLILIAIVAVSYAVVKGY